MKKSKTSVKGIDFPIFFRILGYKTEENAWAAHCLEVDIVGYGRNFEAALADLTELLRMQISFAVFKQQPTLLDRPAPMHILESYHSLFRDSLNRLTSNTPANKEKRLTSIALPVQQKKNAPAIMQWHA